MEFFAVLTALTCIFLGALVGGRLAALCHVPRVTGYLLAGMLLSPSLAHLLGWPAVLKVEALQTLELVSQVALGMILLSIGGQLRPENLRRWRHRILLFSLAEAGLTLLLVGGAALVVNLLFLRYAVPGLSLGMTTFYLVVFLGIISVATAPAATLMVVRECESEGPLTQATLTLVGLNNILALFGFVLAAHWLIKPAEGMAPLLGQLLNPLLAGGVIGLLLAIWAERLDKNSEFKLLLLGGVTLVTVTCHLLQCDPLLAYLALGASLANGSPRWHRLAGALREIDYPIYVVFFVLAGANLHFETLAHIGLLGIGYVVARMVGKLGGAWLGARFGRFGERMRRWTGLTLLAQAGVAIGLADSLARQWPAGGAMVETVVLGSVVIFELIGPLAVRHGLVRAGEVPILSLLEKRAPEGAFEGLHHVVQHFRSSLGIPAGHRLKDPGDILVRHVMRRNVETLCENTPFNELLRQIAHSRYDRFPVVDQEDRFVGMVDYSEIRSLLFEPSVAQLIVASDLVHTARAQLNPDQSLRQALEVVRQHPDISYFPVVDPDRGSSLLGILSQNDLLAAFRKQSS
jgi:Kef-type K+ transport system membrane component KefB/predicted transcriptional regulator